MKNKTFGHFGFWLLTILAQADLIDQPSCFPNQVAIAPFSVVVLDPIKYQLYLNNVGGLEYNNIATPGAFYYDGGFKTVVWAQGLWVSGKYMGNNSHFK